MASRTIKAVVTTYIGVDGVPRAGLRGETVELKADTVEEFDAGEALVAGPAPDPEPVVVVDEPPRAGRGSSAEAWSHYAEALGLDVPEGASRDDVIALVDAEK